MIEVLLSSIVLSLIHASIPNHWMPLIVVGRAENWSRAKLLLGTAIAGTSHVLSTIFIGIGVGWIGIEVSSEFSGVQEKIAPTILLAFGLVYILLWKTHHHHHHLHSNRNKRNSYGAILVSLSLAMFFSPCLELEAYYFTAGSYGWLAVFLVSLVYLVVTVFIMMVLVYTGSLGIQKLNLHWLEHNERLIVGLILVLLGLNGFWNPL